MDRLEEADGESTASGALLERERNEWLPTTDVVRKKVSPGCEACEIKIEEDYGC